MPVNPSKFFKMKKKMDRLATCGKRSPIDSKFPPACQENWKTEGTSLLLHKKTPRPAAPWYFRTAALSLFLSFPCFPPGIFL
jgi:hypothetical protein